MGKRLLRLRQIIAPDGVLPIGRTRFYSGVTSGEFPQPQKVGSVSLWDSDAIEGVLSRILAGSCGPDFSESSAEMAKRAKTREANLAKKRAALEIERAQACSAA